MRIPTVTVDRGGVAVVINRHDFNPARDVLWSDRTKQPEPEGPQVSIAAPIPIQDELAVLKAQADARGIAYHHRAGVAKLRELLAQADA